MPYFSHSLATVQRYRNRSIFDRDAVIHCNVFIARTVSSASSKASHIAAANRDQSVARRLQLVVACMFVGAIRVVQLNCGAFSARRFMANYAAASCT